MYEFVHKAAKVVVAVRIPEDIPGFEIPVAKGDPSFVIEHDSAPRAFHLIRVELPDSTDVGLAVNVIEIGLIVPSMIGSVTIINEPLVVA